MSWLICVLQEVRKAGAVKQQLEVYKRQVVEVQTKLTEETKRADKFEFESKRSQDKIAALQREKEASVLLFPSCSFSDAKV